MFFLAFLSIAFDIHSYIDGLENVEYSYNQQSQELEVSAKDQEISIFFQNSPDIQIYAKTPSFNQTIQKNGFRIPKYSKLTIKANWEQYDDYVAGFFNETNCDFIYYSRSSKTAVPLFLYFGKKICVYHLHKSSDITIGNLQFSKVARFRASSEFLELKSGNINMIADDQNDQILIRNYKRIKASYGDEYDGEYDDGYDGGYDDGYDGEDEEDFISVENEFTYAAGYIFLALGALFYLVIGFCFTPLGCDCCKCKCCNKVEQLRKFIDNRGNGFYTQTLAEFDEIIVRGTQSDESLS